MDYVADGMMPFEMIIDNICILNRLDDGVCEAQGRSIGVHVARGTL